MNNKLIFTFVRCFGEPQPFAPMPEKEWDNIHSSTKAEGFAVWAGDEEELMVRYQEQLDDQYSKETAFDDLLSMAFAQEQRFALKNQLRNLDKFHMQ